MHAAGLLRGHNKPHTLNYNRVASKANRIVKAVMRNHKRKTAAMERKGASLVAQIVKCLSTMQETRGLSPGLGRSPGKEMATHSGSLARRISWTEVPDGLQSKGS